MIDWSLVAFLRAFAARWTRAAVVVSPDNDAPLSPQERREHEVLGLRSYFGRVFVWPVSKVEIDPEAWLSNFDLGRDREIAVELLNSFLYFNQEQTRKMFHSAFASIASNEQVIATLSDSERAWSEFRDAVVVTYPTGKKNPSDSGHIFVRSARQELGVGEERLYEPDVLVRELAKLSTADFPIVLVDDFAGSGDQFVETMTAPYRVGLGNSTLQDEARRLGIRVIYAPAVCTNLATVAIARSCPEVTIHSAYHLPARYSAADPDSLLVPAEMVAELEPFVLKYSARIGVPPQKAFGWARLGLAIAFEHSVPDATLPILRNEGLGWKALRRRR